MRASALLLAALALLPAVAAEGRVTDAPLDERTEWWTMPLMLANAGPGACHDPAIDLLAIDAALRDETIDVFEVSADVADLSGALDCHGAWPLMWAEERSVGVALQFADLLYVRYLPDEGRTELVLYMGSGDVFVDDAPTPAVLDGSTLRFELPVVGVVNDRDDPSYGALYDFRGRTVFADGRGYDVIRGGVEPASVELTELRATVNDWTLPVRLLVPST